MYDFIDYFSSEKYNARLGAGKWVIWQLGASFEVFSRFVAGLIVSFSEGRCVV